MKKNGRSDKRGPTKRKASVRSTQRSVSKPARDEGDLSLQQAGKIRSYSYLRFAGVALGGGKTDKTAVAVIEFFPEQGRLFLRSLRDKVSSRGESTADDVLVETLTVLEKELALIAVDAPIQLPKCIRCRLRCPGIEECREPAVKWMRDLHRRSTAGKKPKKMFAPYTERAAELHIMHELEEAFYPSHALGANAAPLAARMQFLRRRLKTPFIEVFPKLSIWRIGNSLNVAKSHLRFHKHAVDSDEARHAILKALLEKKLFFIYQQDLRLMVENSSAFDAFICALTAFLKFQKQTEGRPASFPKGEVWIDFPKQKLTWS